VVWILICIIFAVKVLEVASWITFSVRSRLPLASDILVKFSCCANFVRNNKAG
jgi:hypothetical protein